MANDCRTCKHNTYGDSPQITDWVSCMHPVTLAKTPKWEAGDPSFVSMRTGDLHVRDMQMYLRECPTWESKS